MNLREELYRSGGGLIVAHVYTKKGKRVPVLDPARRTKAAVLKLLLSGLTRARPRGRSTSRFRPSATLACGPWRKRGFFQLAGLHGGK